MPTLTWINEHELRLRVNDIGNIQTSKPQVDDIRIIYTVPKWIWDRLGAFEAERLRSERESQELANAGKLSKEDLRASIATEEAVAEEHAKFRQWVLANATEETTSPSRRNTHWLFVSLPQRPLNECNSMPNFSDGRRPRW